MNKQEMDKMTEKALEGEVTISDMELELEQVGYLLDILGNPYDDSYSYVIWASGLSYEHFMAKWVSHYINTQLNSTGGIKMENENAQTNNPVLGTWDKLSTEETERKPKVEFELNKAVKVVFLEDNPQEFTGDNGAYYLFNVEQESEAKVIMTSAWTLLKALKRLSPLSGKVIEITKVMDKGKQHFEAKEAQ